MRVKYQQRINRSVIMVAQQFMREQKSGGIVLAVAVIAALLLANSPLRHHYFEVLEMPFGFVFNGIPFLNFSLEHWINDGLMSMFFFVVGLELKREFIGGELRHLRNVVLPVAAAVAGMVVPALIYLIVNGGTPSAQGWGIPMATDIAFALAVLFVLGDRVPASAKVFLTTLAVVDDLGSVVVIALFYTSQISVPSIIVGVALLTVMLAGNRMGVKNTWFYAILGIGGVWTAFLMSGVHATIAAVLAAFMIPADAAISESAIAKRLKKQLKRFDGAESNDVMLLEEQQVHILARMQTDTQDAIPPLQRLEHGMNPFVSFFVMPVFALANAGVAFVDMDVATEFFTPVALGVMAGLLIGKPLGISAAVWLLVKLGVGRLPRGLRWQHVIGLGLLASIGFTMSMFVTALAFTNPEQIVQSKLGIFAASLLGGILGYVVLCRQPSRDITE